MSYKPLSDLKKMKPSNYIDSVMLAFAAETVIASRLLPNDVVQRAALLTTNQEKVDLCIAHTLE